MPLLALAFGLSFHSHKGFSFDVEHEPRFASYGRCCAQSPGLAQGITHSHFHNTKTTTALVGNCKPDPGMICRETVFES